MDKWVKTRPGTNGYSELAVERQMSEARKSLEESNDVGKNKKNTLRNY